VCAKKNKQEDKPEDDADGLRVVARNRKARYNYHILDTFEAGLALTGNEVKSVRQGEISLGESYARPRDGELFLLGCHIAPYENTGFDQPEPTRPRKLLLKKSEIRRITGKVVERGFTLVPLRVYFKRQWAKVEIALARGKGHSDKRADLKKRSQSREIDRALRSRGRKSRGGGR
jgi:SsrA-binding protein